MGFLQGRPLKLSLIVVAGLVLAGGLVAAAILGRSTAGAPAATTAAATSATPAHSGFPAPPKRAVVYARQWGGDALALGIVPRGRGALVQASVLGAQGKGVSGLAISLNGRRAAGCGRGCYRTRFQVTPKSIELRVQSTRWQVPLPAPWPPRDASALLRRAAATWRSLASLSMHEHLASDAVHATTSDWRIQAPDRVAYQVANGWAGIVVGDKRWDRAPRAKKWVQSPQTPLTQPVPSWAGVSDAHVLGTGSFHGRPVWNVSFFDPATPAWFAVSIDKKTNRTLQSTMVATAHFMRDVYRSFNATPAVAPPG